MLAADFLEANYDPVFTPYESLLNSDNYVTRRQSLKLLGELLLDRGVDFFKILFCSPHYWGEGEYKSSLYKSYSDNKAGGYKDLLIQI